MSELKLEIRKQTAQDIGVRVEDRFEAMKLEQARAQGAHEMALQLQRQVEALHAHVDKEIDAGLYPDLKFASIIKQWVTRASAVCGSGAQSAANSVLVAKGKVQAVEDALKIIASVHQDAAKRLALLQSATPDEDGPPSPASAQPGLRVDGERPRESIRARREREAKQEAAAGSSDPPAEPVSAADTAVAAPGDGTVTTPGATDADNPG